MPSVGWTRRRGTNARMARAGRGPRDVSIGRSGRSRDGDRPGLEMAGRRGPRAGGADRRRGTSSARGARRPRRTRGGRRAAVVEPEERADRRLEVGRARGAQEDRVGVGGEALRLRQADRIGGVCHRSGAARESKTTFVSGTKGRAFRGATLIRRCRTLVTDGTGSAAADRRCPLSLALCAGAYWRRSGVRRRSPFGPEAPGSIPRRRRSGSHQPPDLWADVRRVLVPFTARCS